MNQSLIYKNEIVINDNISVLIPTVGEIIDNEESYYKLISLFTAMPIDLMAQLNEVGIDFTTINDYELFLLLFQGIKKEDTSLVLDAIDLSGFELAVNEQNGNVVLLDKANDIVIDRAIYEQIADALRKIHNLEKDLRKPANKEAKEYMIKRAAAKLKRNRAKAESSQLEPLIVAMVNTEQYKYDFERTRELSIYQFNESVRQVIKKVEYNNKMYGVYTGNLNIKDLNQNDLNWLSNK